MIILYTIEKGINGTKFYGTIEPSLSDMMNIDNPWAKNIKKFLKIK